MKMREFALLISGVRVSQTEATASENALKSGSMPGWCGRSTRRASGWSRVREGRMVGDKVGEVWNG